MAWDTPLEVYALRALWRRGFPKQFPRFSFIPRLSISLRNSETIHKGGAPVCENIDTHPHVFNVFALVRNIEMSFLTAQMSSKVVL